MHGNKLHIVASPIRNLGTPTAAEMKTRFLKQVPFLLCPIPSLFLPPFPSHFDYYQARLTKVGRLVFMEVIVPVWGEREAYDWRVAEITQKERWVPTSMIRSLYKFDVLICTRLVLDRTCLLLVLPIPPFAPRSAHASPVTYQNGACTERYDFYHTHTYSCYSSWKISTY